MQEQAKKKRVLIVCQHFWPENFRINDIADYFVEQGHAVDVLCGLPNYPKGEFLPGYGYLKKRHEIRNNIRIDRVLEIKRGNNSNLRIFLNYISYPFFSLFHIPKLCFRKYDHIFIYQLSPVMMASAGILLGKIKRIPTTMYVLDLWPENLFSVLDIKNKFLRSIVTHWSDWYYKKANKLIALSSAMQERLAVVTGKPKKDISIIPQVAEAIYEQTIEDKSLKKKHGSTFNVLFTGNISPAQDPGSMVSAAEILYKKGLHDIRWIIVGDGMSRKDMELMVSEKGLSDIFTFEGFKPVEDIPKYANIANVLVGCLVKSTLLEATIPAKVMSYIALAKPVVLAMDGEAQDLINNKIGNGFAGQSEKPEELADNILKVYNMTDKQRAILGEKAREYHSKNLSRNKVLGELAKIIVDTKES